jgi:hypothetical protein
MNSVFFCLALARCGYKAAWSLPSLQPCALSDLNAGKRHCAAAHRLFQLLHRARDWQNRQGEQPGDGRRRPRLLPQVPQHPHRRAQRHGAPSCFCFRCMSLYEGLQCCACARACACVYCECHRDCDCDCDGVHVCLEACSRCSLLGCFLAAQTHHHSRRLTLAGGLRRRNAHHAHAGAPAAHASAAPNSSSSAHKETHTHTHTRARMFQAHRVQCRLRNITYSSPIVVDIEYTVGNKVRCRLACDSENK